MSEEGHTGCDVLVVGEYYFDLVFRGLPRIPQLGTDIWAREFDWAPGGAYSTALALTRLGSRAGWWCRFGNDVFSLMIIEEASKDGLDGSHFIHVDHPLRRVSAAFSFTEDRGFISYSEYPEPFPVREDLERIRPRVLMLQGLSLDPRWLALIEAARSMGIIVCMDCQNTEATLSTPGMIQVLRSVDVFLPNATEACAVTGAGDVEAALDILSQYCRTTVIKCGKDGAVARRDGDIYRVPALQVEVFDTTGAGDSFNGGFAHGLLTESDFSDALELGVICGSLAVTGYGGRNLPFKDEIDRYRRK
ncbi:MAG TPA: PfkB family carbohydrate kinase [Albidovulum sp.]|uniref:carbohydrate kinase family protein n=1 Tax=Albidovulum sp. TaxID=1872424 RepID=UPI002C1517F8|nr:PfkB family carbohydrate kinase [Albidovulum sp.]